MTTTLIVPGLNSSGSAHWQTWLEHELPDAVRVVQRDWKSADLPEWSSRVRREISRHAGRILIAAHSFGALAAVQAAEDYRHRIAGVLLVAPADPERFGLAEMLPTTPLGFPSTLVASTNDPWLSFARAADLAALWGTKLVVLGAAGHINAEAGYGPWPFGLALLRELWGESLRRGESIPANQSTVDNEQPGGRRGEGGLAPASAAERAPKERLDDAARRGRPAFSPTLRTAQAFERPAPRRRSNNVYEL